MKDTLLQDLRGRFRETTRIRIDEMTALLAQLDADPLDAEAVKKLSTHFHGLAGMGGTYGFPRISELADEAEGLIFPLVSHERAPDAAMVVRWRQIVEEINSSLEGASGAQPA